MGFIVIVGSAVALGLGVVLWRRSKGRAAAKRRMRRAVEGLTVLRSPALREVRFLGVGNAGCVFSAQLGQGWEQALGITWRAADWSAWGRFDATQHADAAPSRVAIKLAGFKGEAPRRLAVLEAFARESEADFAQGGVVALCPFLALGMTRDEHHATDYVLEIMPLIGGESLADRLPRGLADAAGALRELKRILATAQYLEQKGYYSRNVDAENVIVQPDGGWMRIDYDTISREDSTPAKRIRRMARLTEAVLRALPAAEASAPVYAETLERLRAAQQAGNGPAADSAPVRTATLIGWIDGLTAPQGRGA